ncbi:serine hydrolase [Chryseomicrobium sp. FSL W7-1435]|uniref:D-alanyl-D-alanine carboxypeptidase family protein n=1 Tax=Chryseomicrobium sp. FSL W7-1435 TaxID=2921704 RepID=UPI00315B3A77
MELPVTMASFAVIDAESGRLLSEQNAFQELPPASITKIWTVYVALQEKDKNEQVRISRNASNQEGSSVYLKRQELWSLESLLYATMLQSGNDAAVAVAEHVAGSEMAFAALMNLYAKKAGVKQTWFMNASGLHEDIHLTTAYDMSLLFKTALEDESFREIATATLYAPDERAVTWHNKHRLVAEQTAIAGKTGFTKKAGRTLISYFEQNEKKLIVVSLNEANDWKLHTELQRKTFELVDRVTIQGDYVTSTGIQIKVSKPYHFLKKNEEKLQNIVHLKKGQTQGLWEVKFTSTTLAFPISYTME